MLTSYVGGSAAMKACEPPRDPQEREVYDQVLRAYKAYGEVDIKTLKEIYPGTPDQIVFLEGPQMRVLGWDEFEKFFLAFSAAYGELVCTALEDFKFVRASENAAFAFGTVANVFKEKSTGFPIRWLSRTTICFVKKNGKWKMIHHHDSVPNSLVFILTSPSGYGP
jgi:ketosteroid isomerase-like protein